MSQADYEAVCNVLIICRNILQVILFLLLLSNVLPVKKGRGTAAAVLMLFAVNIVSEFWKGSGGFRYVASLLLVIGYCFLCLRKYWERAVFASLAFYNFHCLDFLLEESVHLKVMNKLISRLDVTAGDYLFQLNSLVIVGQATLTLTHTIFLGLMVVVLCKVLRKPFQMTAQDMVLLSVLNIVGSILAHMVVNLSIIRLEQDVFILYEERQELFWEIPIMAGCIFAGEIFLIYFWQRYRQLMLEKQKHFMEEQQIRATKKRLEEVEDFYGDVRKVRHEMRNHMMNLKGLAASEQYEEIGKYIGKLDDTMQQLEYKYATGNAVTDVIINDKWRRCEKLGISFEADFQYQGEIPVFDMGIILNNLLDNAIEACEKLKQEQRFIRLALKRKKQFLLLNVENSFDGKISHMDDDPFPQTTKESGLPEMIMEHGIGLKNVQDVAQRYFGGLNIKMDNNVFHVLVMLQQNKEMEDTK